ncbi:MAG: hypothetical protein K9N46_02285 [Candidatus Marinimicrobia bacterium]|nr:hypothetical protein [Candidatus Neomarinimicrobiota bacterium]MCF7828274.1 hypothetical protein [Candidatus Neomarinimicrobiota bacterium]MCF7879551.1 hypothetical protein [Candidatus Neomarinimicrobiota bacterium]
MQTTSSMDMLETKIDQLVETVEELHEENSALKDEINTLKLKDKDENMNTVKREIIRTKIQNMLNVLNGM